MEIGGRGLPRGGYAALWVRLAWRRIAVVLLVSTAALPALAWAASLLIGNPVLRSGMQAAGVAPAEVATVALCVIAGAEAAVCAALLAASTIITVVAAGPILSLMGASVTVSSAGLLGNLAVVIALPLAVGVALRTVWSPGPQVDAVVRLVTVLALLLLLWQVASQIRLNSAYVTVIVALVVYVAGSAVLGWVLALRAPGSAPDGPGWRLRVVPNKYPAVRPLAATVSRSARKSSTRTCHGSSTATGERDTEWYSRTGTYPGSAGVIPHRSGVGAAD